MSTLKDISLNKIITVHVGNVTVLQKDNNFDLIVRWTQKLVHSGPKQPKL